MCLRLSWPGPLRWAQDIGDSSNSTFRDRLLSYNCSQPSIPAVKHRYLMSADALGLRVQAKQRRPNFSLEVTWRALDMDSREGEAFPVGLPIRLHYTIRGRALTSKRLRFVLEVTDPSWLISCQQAGNVTLAVSAPCMRDPCSPLIRRCLRPGCLPARKRQMERWKAPSFSQSTHCALGR